MIWNCLIFVAIDDETRGSTGGAESASTVADAPSTIILSLSGWSVHRTGREDTTSGHEEVIALRRMGLVAVDRTHTWPQPLLRLSSYPLSLPQNILILPPNARKSWSFSVRGREREKDRITENFLTVKSNIKVWLCLYPFKNFDWLLVILFCFFFPLAL